MAQPYDRVYNFSAGPCTLPVPVLEQARDEMLNYRGAGMSVMEMSHRSKDYEAIIQKAEADLRTIMGVPDGYKVLFLQGGATLQFSMIPISFLPKDGSADYIVTGTWGKKAVEAASLEGKVNVLFDAKSTNYDRCPSADDLQQTPGASYIHYTSNETVQGVDFLADLDLSGTVICDMSSNIMSRPCHVSKYAMIYAGAQKNMGPAGVAVVIVRDELVALARERLHPMLDYRLQIENDSMYNTPPCYSIYVCGLVYQWLINLGGLAAMEKINEEKAKLLYDAIDSSGGFYKGHAQPANRSRMNVTFTLANEELTDTFVKEAKSNKLDGLKGHRSVGGIRASIYNAFPKEGCEVLASFMRDFAAKNG
ncbi:MAG: 3-phosphoserine/phosphohydroxythreonine transaminase [Fimbriimonadaceae bacterium]|nr:3-phosphoserine/phosphohydroxythreonine transaminase [Fimbriimonadaceae bacterium]